MQSRRQSRQYRRTRFEEITDEGPVVSQFLLCYNTLAFKLLVFFVFLTTLGRQNPQTFLEAVHSFPLRVPHAADLVTPVIPSKTNFLNQIEGTAKRFGLLVSRTKSKIVVAAPTSELFLPDDDQIRAAWVPKLLALLMLAKQGQVPLQFAISNTNTDQAESDAQLLLDRASTLVRLAEDTGISSTLIAQDIQPFRATTRRITEITFRDDTIVEDATSTIEAIAK